MMRLPLTCLPIALAFVGVLALHTLAGRSTESPRDREEPAGASAGHRVLIVTGEDYQGHKWRKTTPVLRQQLERDDRLRVAVVNDLTKLAETDLTRFVAVVMHFKNYDPNVPGRAGYDNLAGYVKAGGGLVLVHFACGAFQEFKGDFETLAGRVWNPKLRGHDPYGRFRVDITNIDHPVTRGMTSFEITDELYTCLDGETEIDVLATAVSKVDQKVYPMAFVLNYGKGRVFHCVLGHDVAALRNDGAGALYRRGTVWAAGLEQRQSAPGDPANEKPDNKVRPIR